MQQNFGLNMDVFFSHDNHYKLLQVSADSFHLDFVWVGWAPMMNLLAMAFHAATNVAVEGAMGALKPLLGRGFGKEEHSLFFYLSSVRCRMKLSPILPIFEDICRLSSPVLA